MLMPKKFHLPFPFITKTTISILVVLGLTASLTSLGLIATPTVQAACAALPTTNGTVTFNVDTPSTATYRFWTHIYSPSAGNNALYLQVDNTYCSITVGNNNAIPAGQFSWVDYQNGSTTNKINLSLTAGSHAVKLAGLDPGVGVDKVLLASDTSCTPTGDGSNCIGAASTPTPSPTVVITPTSGATPAPDGSTQVSGAITLPKSSGMTRSYYIDGKPVAAGSLDTTKLSDGQHTLKIVDTTADGKTTTTVQKLSVVNSGFTKFLNWFKQPLHATLVVVALLLGLGGLGFWLLRLRGSQPFKFHFATLGSQAAHSGPPATTVIYPVSQPSPPADDPSPPAKVQ